MKQLKAGRFIVSMILIAGALGVGFGPVAARQEAVATLLVTAGSVTITPVDGSDAYDLPVDEVAVVNVGDEIVVAEASEAWLTFFEGAETRLGPKSQAKIDKLEVDDTGAEITLTLSVGQAASKVASDMTGDSHTEFSVNTPAASISVRGTEFLVFARENELTQVATQNGLVAVTAMGAEAEVPCGYGLKLLPGEAPGELKVWGQSTITLTSPVGDVANVPVTFINQDTGQEFFYRTGDLMMVALGGYDVVINTPVPHRLSDVGYGDDLAAEQIVPLEIAMSGMTINLVAADGTIDNSAGAVYLRLKRADGLAAESVVTAGVPFIIGPGQWSIEAALDDTFEQSQQLELDVPEGDVIMLPLELADFES